LSSAGAEAPVAPPRTPRIGAVLLLAYPRGSGPHVVFTERTHTLSNHRGQISLPGGSRDPDDPDLATTALRETYEELGIVPEDVDLLGRLDDVYVYVSNFLIAPYVGALDYEPTFMANPAEVARTIEVPLARLRSPDMLREEEWNVRGELRRVQIYQHGAHQIWGATARVIQEFLTSPYPSVLARRFALRELETPRPDGPRPEPPPMPSPGA
jgi:8-oxo-dGTP pyrophosphatase MutT (NUDIX family)